MPNQNSAPTGAVSAPHPTPAARRPRRGVSYRPSAECLEVIQLPSGINFPGVPLDGLGRIAAAAVYDEQDGAIHSYHEGPSSPTNPNAVLPPYYFRAPIGYRGDTIVPVSVTLDGIGRVFQAVVYDEQDGALQTYQQGLPTAADPNVLLPPTYSRAPIGYRGDTIVPIDVTLDASGRVSQAIVYDEQDASVQTYRAGASGSPPTYTRLPIGYAGDVVVPVSVSLDGLGRVATAVVYDEQDGAIHSYQSGSAGPGVLGGTPASYNRLPLGYRGDTVVPLSVFLDGAGRVGLAAVYDLQDAAIHTYHEGTAGPGVIGGARSTYGRVPLGYPGDTIIPYSASLDSAGDVVAASVYDEQDGAVHFYRGILGSLGGVTPSYARVPLGYAGDVVVPISVDLDQFGRLAQASVYDEQDGAVQSYRAGAQPVYSRAPLAYRGDVVVPFTRNALLFGLPAVRSAFHLG